VREALVSLVMPVWNARRDWLLQAVRSALGQRGCRLELVVVDDGCPAPVKGLLADVGDERVRVLRIDHGGECEARNVGIAAARGEWIRFVDADDVLEAESTARLLALASGDEGVIAYGATTFCNDELRPVWTMTCNLEGFVAEECLLGRFTVRPFSLLFPRPVVEKTGQWDPGFRVSQDWDYVLRALEHARVRGERAVATYYRKHPASATADLTAGEHGGRRVLERFLERHPELRGSALERRAEARLEAIAARASLTRGHAGATARHLSRALRLSPGAVAEESRLALTALAGGVRAAIRPAQPVWA
jgi:glycosyltransferase involved in cell wall biosynthesis